MAEIQPHQFQDKSGHVWSLEVTIKNYLSLKRDRGIDLRTFTEEESTLFKALTLQTDYDTILDVVVELCSGQMRDLGISEDDFYALLDPATFDRVGLALMEAIVNFMPAHQRLALKAALKGVDEGLERAAKKLEEKAETLVQEALLTLESSDSITSSSGTLPESSD